jgi:hypothetical protein
MIGRNWFTALLAGIAFIPFFGAPPAPACCPAPPSGKPVVNADQTVIIIWDAAAKTQHFIRQASFKSEADDFGFIVPSPSMPELEESGNDAFPFLAKLTEPEIIHKTRPSNGGGCGCAAQSPREGIADLSLEDKKSEPAVNVLLDKQVAGFNAKVLETKSAEALTGWLKEHGYAFSPEVQAWAAPYVEQGWKFIALQVAKDKGDQKVGDKQAKTPQRVATAALRISFQTDRPLFPYREPDSKSAAETLHATARLLRIYFVGEARYKGELTKDIAWTGNVAWTNKLSAESRTKALRLLKLLETTGPAEWWLTEFEDHWPYRLAPADVYFSPDADQSTRKRDPIVIYVSTSWPHDAAAYAFAVVLIVPPLVRRLRRAK